MNVSTPGSQTSMTTAIGLYVAFIFWDVVKVLAMINYIMVCDLTEKLKLQKKRSVFLKSLFSKPFRNTYLLMFMMIRININYQ